VILGKGYGPCVLYILTSLLFILVAATPSGYADPGEGQSQKLFDRGVQLQQSGDLQGARDAYLAALKLAPRRADAHSNLGLVLARLGQYDQAIQHYLKALEAESRHPGIRLYLGIAYFQTQQFGLAEREFTRVVTAQPSNYQARQLLGVCLLKQNRLNEGIDELERVYKAQPGNLDVAYTLGSAYITNGYLQKAKTMVEGTFKSLDAAEARLIIGSFHLAVEDYPKAVEELTEARRLNSKLPTLNSQLGYAYLLTDKRKDALPLFQEELMINPSDFNANAFGGWLCREDGRLDEASVLLKRALDLKPNDSGILFQLAQIAKSREFFPEAAALLESVIARRPDFTPAHILLAQTYNKLKRFSDAEQERSVIDRLNAEEQKKQSSVRERLEHVTGIIPAKPSSQ
jgi:tetratricopeptide (TPR) repeat protein